MVRDALTMCPGVEANPASATVAFFSQAWRRSSSRCPGEGSIMASSQPRSYVWPVPDPERPAGADAGGSSTTDSRIDPAGAELIGRQGSAARTAASIAGCAREAA